MKCDLAIIFYDIYEVAPVLENCSRLQPHDLDCSLMIQYPQKQD